MVFGDMMFGRGGEKQDREIILSKVSVLLKKGPGGWWRVVKNSARYLARVQEKPISRDVGDGHFVTCHFAASKEQAISKLLVVNRPQIR